MLNINIDTPKSITDKIKIKFKEKRLCLNLTQEGLSKRSGVSLGSLKRFESSGNISFESLLKLALVLECLDDFNGIANIKEQPLNSIDDVFKVNKDTFKKRGSIK